MTLIRHAPKPHSTHSTTAPKAPVSRTPVPTEAEVRSIRAAIDGNNQPEDVSGALPKGVETYQKKLQAQVKKDDQDVSVQSLKIGAKQYFVVSADDEGNGFSNIVDPKGNLVTSYSYSESEGPNWDASPQEAKREAAVGAAASHLFTRTALGTATLKKYEIPVTALPANLQAQVKNNNVKTEHFYKANLNGLPVIADYALYQGADKKPATQIGNVTLYNAKGEWQGSADILNKTKDRLFFGLNLGRPE